MIPLVTIGILIIIELAALLWLASTVSSYRNFWKQKANEPGEITYLALGDSAAQAIGASSPNRGYVGQIATRLQEQTGKTVRTVNLSVTGAKMQDYLRDQAPQIKDVKFDIVTIEIGANDIAHFEPTAFRADFKKVLASLPAGSYVADMPLFNSRPARTASAKQASKIIQEELLAYPALHFVGLEAQTTAHQSIFTFAPDLFHPNDLGYKNWADAFWARIEDSDFMSDK